MITFSNWLEMDFYSLVDKLASNENRPGITAQIKLDKVL